MSGEWLCGPRGTAEKNYIAHRLSIECDDDDRNPCIPGKSAAVDPDWEKVTM